MNTFGKAIIGVALGLVFSSGVANAAIIYDNGSPFGGSGYDVTSSVVADDFTLGAGGAIGGAGIHIAAYGDEIERWDGTVDYFLFADNAGTPGTLLTSGSGQNTAMTDMGFNVSLSHNIFLVEFDFESLLAAAAGTTYWLGIHLSEGFDLEGVYWVSAALNGVNAGQASEGGTFDNWSENSWDHAFFLTDGERVSVPEPSILALLGAGLFSLGLIRRRRHA